MDRSLNIMIALGLVGTPGLALPDSLAIEATAVSEVAYRGLSETFDRAAVGINAEWASDGGIHAGLSFLEGDARPVRQRERSLTAYLGWQTKFAEDWHTGVSVAYREFPNSTKEWDFVEYQAAIGWQDRISLELAWSPDYYEHNTESFAVAVRGFQPLSRRFFISAEVGSVSLSRDDFFDYRYAAAAVGVRHQRWVAELAYTEATDQGDILFGQALESPGLTLEISYLVR